MTNRSFAVVLKQNIKNYPAKSPFNPSENYPEYKLKKIYKSKNYVYGSVRQLFRYLGYDHENFESSSWNPLGLIINKGETVLIKPNMIAESHRYTNEWEHVITHGSIIRAVIDYVYIALNGEGRIIIADAPQTDSKIDLIKKRMGIDNIQELYWKEKKFEIEFIDLRNEFWSSEKGICTNKIKLPGDPLGNILFDLGKSSYLSENDEKGKRYYGAFYDIEETNKHHRNGRHEYLISRTAIKCDSFISIPKLKTHKKVGVTLNLKGLVGINGDKNYLPHYAIGSSEEAGDQFDKKSVAHRLENAIVLKAKRYLIDNLPIVKNVAVLLKDIGYRVFGDTEEVIRSGNWYGNDTCWRMALDLNRILLYGREDGTMSNYPKKYFSIIDGIIGMEGNGPVAGKPVNTGLLIAGVNPLAVDMVSTYLLGFDYRKIPMLYRAFDKDYLPISWFDPEDIEVLSNIQELQGKIFKDRPNFNLNFKPHFGWQGHIERIE